MKISKKVILIITLLYFVFPALFMLPLMIIDGYFAPLPPQFKNMARMMILPQRFVGDLFTPFKLFIVIQFSVMEDLTKSHILPN